MVRILSQSTAHALLLREGEYLTDSRNFHQEPFPVPMGSVAE